MNNAHNDTQAARGARVNAKRSRTRKAEKNNRNTLRSYTGRNAMQWMDA